jgi:tRNA pseudouridine32 synthase/23S rRNA pseudouridine746 synthase
MFGPTKFEVEGADSRETVGPTEFKVTVANTEDDPRDLLVNESGLSAARVASAMDRGAVWHRNTHGIRRLRRRSVSLQPGDEIFMNYDDMVLTQTCAPAELIHDGGRWSVWHKPFGMRSQGSRWGDHTTLARFAEKNLSPERTSFIVHRLDMAAQGLMLLAHDKKAAANISGQFADRTVGKRYYAVVHGKFPSPDHPQNYDYPIDDKKAETSAKRITYLPDTKRSIVEVGIRTGRKHQIRRHLSEAGFPIVGDRMYGRDGDTEDLCLQASYLSFNEPESGERAEYERVPADWL